ncbi:hypothetical protein Poli38472_010173 [Pythium oligandrum]|uniref:C2 domain-containing protein n=1 Tax=Pythium oligandrum TaxID=41045 RepID=A0A8K1C8G5_PYTOL|nr:hypothetical protein Poli38472_010173 [Pythium oligandrum]|eukprot:TMW58614.1 hypothetical protein Poli38472_010173 [Pythium oligandrum]
MNQQDELGTLEENDEVLLHSAVKADDIAKVTMFLTQGVDINSEDSTGRTLLHEAAQWMAFAVGRELIHRGAHVNALDQGGNRPLTSLILAGLPAKDDDAVRQSRREFYIDTWVEFARFLVMNGAKWSNKDDQRVEQTLGKLERTGHIGRCRSRVLSLVTGLRAWTQEQEAGRKDLSKLPLSVFRRGEDDVRVYFDSIAKSKTLMLHKTICVVGAGQSGKTSFVKCLNAGLGDAIQPETSASRVFECNSSDEAVKKQYQVTVWDDHSRFNIQMRLYAVCVDLKAYQVAVKSGENAMQVFVCTHVFRYFEELSARDPYAEFAVVGTKANELGEDLPSLDTIKANLMIRLTRMEVLTREKILKAIQKIQEELDTDPHDDLRAVLTKQKAQLEAQSLKKTRILINELLTPTFSEEQSKSTLLEAVQEWVSSSELVFPLPEVYDRVQKLLQELTMARNNVIVSIDDIKTWLTTDSEMSTDPATLPAVLLALHDFGEILWLDQTNGPLAKLIFLRPSAIMKIVQQAVELGETRVSHDTLVELPLWNDIKDNQERLLELKLLLSHLRIAYPSGTNRVKWNSDIVIPQHMLQSEIKQPHSPAPLFPHHLRWEYRFRTHQPLDLLAQLCVQSHSPHFSSHRVFSDGAFHTSVAHEYQTQVSQLPIEASNGPTLVVDVRAASMDIAWQQLVWYSMNLEKLLDVYYPALWITRHAISSEGKRLAVDRLVAEGSTKRSSGLLPPSMEWYINKLWRDRIAPPVDQDVIQLASGPRLMNLLLSELSDMETRLVTIVSRCFRVVESGLHDLQARIDATKQSLVQFVKTHSHRLEYPALWTLEYQRQGIQSTYVVKLRSHLTGKCYHEPIELSVGSDFFGKYGVHIKRGLSLFTHIVPNMIGKALVEAIVDACSNELDRSTGVHHLVKDLKLPSYGVMDMEKNRSIQPDESLSLLKDLLQIDDPDFDPAKMPKLSNLECGIVMEKITSPFVLQAGECIWAHRSEIQHLRPKILLRREYLTLLRGSHVPSSGSFIQSEGNQQPGERRTTMTDSDELASATNVLDYEATDSPQQYQDTIDQVTWSEHAGSTTLGIRFMGVRNLRNVRFVGMQSPYCKWKILATDGSELASGRTPRDKHGGCNPDWSTQAYSITIKGERAALEDCTLLCIIKTRTATQVLRETIAKGSYVFFDMNKEEIGKWKEQHVALLAKGEPAGLLRVQFQLPH